MPDGPWLIKGAKWLKVGKGCLVVQGWQRVPSDPRLAKDTKWSRIFQGGTDKQTDTQTHQCHGIEARLSEKVNRS